MPNIVNGLGQVKVGVRISSGGGGGIDTDAQAFITAANITDTTQQNAINTLVTQLKTYGIWTKLKAVYPFVGGTASSHKFNLKDPRDLDAAFRLVFNGGITHSNNGVQFGGTTGYADTKLVPNVNMTTNLNSMHLSSYTRTRPKGALVGADNAHRTVLAPNNIGDGTGVSYYALNSIYASATTTNLPLTGGFYLNTRINSTTVKLFRNNIINSSVTNNTTGLDNVSFYLGARNTPPTPSLFTDNQIAFASIGDGLTDTEAANFYTAVQTFQTTLGRQV